MLNCFLCNKKYGGKSHSAISYFFFHFLQDDGVSYKILTEKSDANIWHWIQMECTIRQLDLIWVI